MEIVGQSEVPAFAQTADTRFHLEPDPGHASLPCRAGAGVLGGPRYVSVVRLFHALLV
jgi:hypothetical protein